MKISSQQSLLQVILLPGEEQTIVTGERLVAPLALLPTVLLLLIELSSGLVSSLLGEGGDGQVTRWAPGKVKLLGHDFLCAPVS